MSSLLPIKLSSSVVEITKPQKHLDLLLFFCFLVDLIKVANTFFLLFNIKKIFISILFIHFSFSSYLQSTCKC